MFIPYFCSEECKSTFTHQDINRVLVENLLAVEKNYLAGLSKPEIEPMEPKILLMIMSKNGIRLPHGKQNLNH